MVAHPKKVTHRINKRSYYIPKWQCPDPVLSEYPNLTVLSAFKYSNALTNRPRASNTSCLAKNNQNKVLKVELAS